VDSHSQALAGRASPTALAVWQEPVQKNALRARVWSEASAPSMSLAKLKKGSTKVSVNPFITLSAVVDLATTAVPRRRAVRAILWRFWGSLKGL
jgi:hypothetical protein